MFEHPLLGLLGGSDGVGVVLQILRELCQEGIQRDPAAVLRIHPHLADEAHQFRVDPQGDRLIDERRRPRRRLIAYDMQNDLVVVEQPPVRLVDGEVDQPVMRAVLHDALEQLTGRWSPRRFQ